MSGRGKGAAAPYHHGDLRTALRTEAERILIERGVAEVSLREVARAAGVSHAAPYRHYPSREALLADIAAGGFRRLSARFEDSAGLEPAERVSALAKAYVGFALEEPAVFRLMFGAELSKPDHPELKAAGDETFAKLREALIALGVPAPATAEAISAWAMAHGLATLTLDACIEDHVGEIDPRAAVETAIALFGAGLRARISSAA